MNKKKLLFIMLIVSVLLVFTVGPAFANPPAGGPPPWSNKDGLKSSQNIFPPIGLEDLREIWA